MLFTGGNHTYTTPELSILTIAASAINHNTKQLMHEITPKPKKQNAPKMNNSKRIRSILVQTKNKALFAKPYF